MQSFSIDEIAEITGGAVEVACAGSGEISIDTRRLEAGAWYLALAGERFDGDDFHQAAAERGCLGSVGTRRPEGWTRGFVRVEDGLRALQALGKSVRDGFDGPVVGITGSAGKTTTRALVGSIASELAPTHQTAGNFNGQVGLPLTLLAVEERSEIWVLELGISLPDEMDRLVEIARPTVRLVTNVGAAHLEGLGSVEAVAREKRRIFADPAPGDVFCLNLDEPHLEGLRLPSGTEVVTFGRAPTADVRVEHCAVDWQRLETRFRLATPAGVVEGSVPAPGEHLADTVCAAAAAGIALGAGAEAIGRGVAGFAAVAGRHQVLEGRRRVLVINDCYNSNPLSARAALRSLSTVTGRPRLAVLGEMLEMGSESLAAHAEIMALCDELDLPAAFVGAVYRRAGERLERQGRDWEFLEGVEELLGGLDGRIREGTVVLVKGSRDAGLQPVVEALL